MGVSLLIRILDGQRVDADIAILDTGVDGSHPDIRGNFNRSLSRNFTVDDPIIDGPCADDPDGSCHDPNNVDEDGHGTHVAGTIASPINGRGIGGVAPDAEIVNLRAGQDSGFFFLQPSVDALTYAANHGIDVVNMSYYIDPWLYNCANNPADTPAQQQEQRTIIAATERAPQLRPQPRRDAGVGARQREHRHRAPDVRRHQPGLPARQRAPAQRRQLVRGHAHRGARGARHLRRSARASARRTTRTTASSRPTCPRRAATAATSSARPSTARRTPGSSRRTRRAWPRPTAT